MLRLPINAAFIHKGDMKLHREHTLFNFDHGFTKEKTFNIGKYSICVSNAQAKNLNNLEKNAIRSFSMDDGLSRKVENIAKKSGRVSETATLKVLENDIVLSVIYTELPERSSIDDFVLFFVVHHWQEGFP